MAICLNPQCRHVNAESSKFCVKCGNALLLLQRYRALRILGQGGFGSTYLAQDEAKPSKPRCVIKQFIYVGPGQAKAAELFEAEAVQLDKLGKHPQIPELYAHCQQNGQQFLVQEFIDGQDLEKELKAEGAFPEAKIWELLLDVLPILDFIHQNQVIHRDIKPANIIRRQQDRKLVVVDFGAAKQASLTAMQKTGTFIGSAEYTAPEQARGKALPASDLYSLAVTCLHLLTGVNPFDLKNLDDEWVWRDFLGGKRVETKLGGVLDRMLWPVSRRYDSAAAVLAELFPSQRPPTVSPQFRVQPTAALNPIPPNPPQAVRQALVSQTTGNDYSELDRALRHREWKKADELTRTFMLKVMSTSGHLSEDEMSRFPGEDLKLIDNLWVQHSEGKLGFSVQKRIWQECGSPGPDYAANKAAWKKFGQRVNWQGGTGYDGWRHAKELDYANPQEYSGQLPGFCDFFWQWRFDRRRKENWLPFVNIEEWGCIYFLFSRRDLN